MSTGTILEASAKLYHRNPAGNIDYSYRLVYVADPNGSRTMQVDGQPVRYVSHVLIAERF